MFRVPLSVILIIAAILFSAPAACAAYGSGPVEFPVPAQDPIGARDERAGDTGRSIRVVFAFFLSGHAAVSLPDESSVPFVGLLDVLQAHTDLKFAVGMSGTLSSTLVWARSGAIQSVRDGVAMGQFEPMGSTYSGSVLAALDPWDRHLAVSLGGGAAANCFGDSPVGFWNPSGVWRQDLIPPIESSGYRYTIVDDKILASGALVMPAPNGPVRTSWGGKELVIFQADTAFARAVDESITTGSPRAAIDYLRGAYDRDIRQDAVVVYAREVPASDQLTSWEGLDRLLTAIEAEPWVVVTSFRGALEDGPPLGSVVSLPEGEPDWVKQAAAKSGFYDWNAYNSGSKPLQGGRRLFSDIRSRIQRIELEVRKAADAGSDVEAARSLLAQAKQVYCWHQAEYGRPGDDDYRAPVWDGARRAYFPLLAAWQCLNPTTSVYQEDIDRDGIDETVLTSPTDMFVMSPIGARLLHWYDLENGEEIVGGGLGASGGALIDAISGVNLAGVDLASAAYSAELGADQAMFSLKTPTVSLIKTVAPSEGVLSVEYTLRARGRPTLVISNYFSLCLPELVAGGPDALAYLAYNAYGDRLSAVASSLTVGRAHGLANVISGTAVEVAADTGGGRAVSPSAVSSDSLLFSRGLAYEYAMSIAAGNAAVIPFQLRRIRTAPYAPPVVWMEAQGDRVAAKLSSYTRSCSVRQVIGGYAVDMPMKRAGVGMLGEVAAPMPQGKFDLLAISTMGRASIVGNAGQYIAGGAGRHEFFPEVRDSRVQLHTGYFRVGPPAASWAIISAIAIGLVIGTVVIVARRKARNA